VRKEDGGELNFISLSFILWKGRGKLLN